MLDLFAMIQIEIDYFLRAKKSDILYSMRFCRSAGARPSNLDFLKMFKTKTSVYNFYRFVSFLACVRPAQSQTPNGNLFAPLAFFAEICYHIVVMFIFAWRYKYGQEKRFSLVQ